jgi:hypothetical protein
MDCRTAWPETDAGPPERKQSPTAGKQSQRKENKGKNGRKAKEIGRKTESLLFSHILLFQYIIMSSASQT